MKTIRLHRARIVIAFVAFAVAAPLFADPASDLANLANQVNSVAFANGFNQGERVSLLTKIIAAIDSLERGHEKTAANQLGAFIHEVKALQRSGRIGDDDAARLTGAANDIIGEL